MNLSDKDMMGLNDGKDTVLVNVHTVDRCAGQPCVIHNPSDHHMAAWKPEWNDTLGNMWRVCPHGLEHPDPDDMSYLRRRWDLDAAAILAEHHCDGCCQPYGLQEKAIEA